MLEKLSEDWQSVVKEMGIQNITVIGDVWAMLDYLNSGWHWFYQAEAYLWLSTIHLGDVLLGYYWPKQTNWLTISNAPWLSIWGMEQGRCLRGHLQRMEWGIGGDQQDGERSCYAPGYGAIFPVLAEAYVRTGTVEGIQ